MEKNTERVKITPRKKISTIGKELSTDMSDVNTGATSNRTGGSFDTNDKVGYALSLAGKYSKVALTQMEAYLQVEKLDPKLRKIILDAFGDLQREQAKILNS